MIQFLLIFSGLATVLLRLILGLIYIAHGYSKFKHFKGNADWFASVGYKPGRFWAGLVASTELIGGSLLVLGFFSQIVAMILMIVMIMAAFTNLRQKQKFIGTIELDLILLFALFLLATLGSGPYSLDQFFGIII